MLANTLNLSARSGRAGGDRSLGLIGKEFLRYLECQRGNGPKLDICACRLMIVATRFQSLRKKVCPHARSGIFSGLTILRSLGSREATGANAPEPYNSPEHESEATGANAPETSKPEASNATGAHVAHNSGDFEWYTPREYIEAAAAVMGGIDLDPASNALANQVVGATRFYTEEDDGLAHPWRGRVWLNPPYAYPLIEQFCMRLTQSLAGGEVAEAIVLANNATETVWFQTLASAASAFCFPRGRIKFWHPGKGLATPLQGQTIIYSGNRVAEFRNEFAKFGVVSHL
jgi:phage N-6-adenine-methyltransferase